QLAALHLLIGSMHQRHHGRAADLRRTARRQRPVWLLLLLLRRLHDLWSLALRQRRTLAALRRRLLLLLLLRRREQVWPLSRTAGQQPCRQQQRNFVVKTGFIHTHLNNRWNQPGSS